MNDTEGEDTKAATDHKSATAKKAEDPFRILAREFLTLEIDTPKKEILLEEATDLLSQTAQTVGAIFSGEQIYRRPADRRRALISVFNHLTASEKRIKRLDPRSALSLFGPLEGRPVTLQQYSVDDNEPGASATSPTTTIGVSGKRLDDYQNFMMSLQLARDNAWSSRDARAIGPAWRTRNF